MFAIARRSAVLYDRAVASEVLDLAFKLNREQFVIKVPELVLVADDAFVKSPSMLVTAVLPTLNWEDTTVSRKIPREDTPTSQPPPALIRLIRKVQRTFPNMITVGRTANNDVVIVDESISKFHAYFQPQGKTLTLADAGSTNGTWVDEEQLSPEGDAVAVRAGSRIRFARIAFTAMESGAFWDRTRQK
jgi:hypothetical protein